MADIGARSTGKRDNVRQPYRRAIKNGMFESNLERRLESDRHEWWSRHTGICGEMQIDRAPGLNNYEPWAQSIREPGASAIVSLEGYEWTPCPPEPPFWLALWRLITRRA